MIAALLTLAAAAAPINCRADLDCLIQTLRTCGPARYADPELDRRKVGHERGVVPVGATELEVSVGKDETCRLTVLNRVDAIELSARLLTQLGRGSEKRRAAELQAARDEGVLRSCALTAEQIKQRLEQQRQRGYSSADWADCKPVGCQAVVPADQGCTWSECEDARRVLRCGEDPKELRCAPWSSAAPHKPGPGSLLLRDHLEAERPCVAVCKTGTRRPSWSAADRSERLDQPTSGGALPDQRIDLPGAALMRAVGSGWRRRSAGPGSKVVEAPASPRAEGSPAVIDLLSDTVTLPSPAMRAAISEAVLGDDVYDEDPTVARLEALAAAGLGKEASALLPSGTMANLVAMLCHCPRGTEVLVGDASDIYEYEAGGASIVGGLVLHPIRTQPDGRLTLEDLAAAVRDPNDSQCAPAGVICLENTHNRCGGVVLPMSYLAEVRRFATEKALPLHLDGARIFNAACALGVPVASIAQYADSIQFCLSKGLAAPIGSMLVGSSRFIRSAKRLRKMLGGGMRQAGIIAAPGIVALEQMVERLAEDHLLARRLAVGLSRLPGVTIELSAVQTNIVIFEVVDPRFTLQTFLSTLIHHQVRMGELGHGRIRAVTHYGISSTDVDAALDVVAQVLKVGPRSS